MGQFLKFDLAKRKGGFQPVSEFGLAAKAAVPRHPPFGGCSTRAATVTMPREQSFGELLKWRIAVSKYFFLKSVRQFSYFFGT